MSARRKITGAAGCAVGARAGPVVSYSPPAPGVVGALHAPRLDASSPRTGSVARAFDSRGSAGSAIGYTAVMATCDVCGNDYDKAMTIEAPGRGSGTFDSFECAIRALAPTCAHCGCTIIGHGIEAGAAMYCCAHCARHEGAKGVADRVA